MARSPERTVFEAGLHGVSQVIPLVAHVAVSLVAYKSFIIMMDAIISGLSSYVGYSLTLKVSRKIWREGGHYSAFNRRKSVVFLV